MIRRLEIRLTYQPITLFAIMHSSNLRDSKQEYLLANIKFRTKLQLMASPIYIKQYIQLSTLTYAGK